MPALSRAPILTEIATGIFWGQVLADSDFYVSVLVPKIALPDVKEFAVSRWIPKCVDAPMFIVSGAETPYFQRC